MVYTKTQTKTLVAVALTVISIGSMLAGLYYYGSRAIKNSAKTSQDSDSKKTSKYSTGSKNEPGPTSGSRYQDDYRTVKESVTLTGGLSMGPDRWTRGNADGKIDKKYIYAATSKVLSDLNKYDGMEVTVTSSRHYTVKAAEENATGILWFSEDHIFYIVDSVKLTESSLFEDNANTTHQSGTITGDLDMDEDRNEGTIHADGKMGIKAATNQVLYELRNLNGLEVTATYSRKETYEPVDGMGLNKQMAMGSVHYIVDSVKLSNKPRYIDDYRTVKESKTFTGELDMDPGKWAKGNADGTINEGTYILAATNQVFAKLKEYDGRRVTVTSSKNYVIKGSPYDTALVPWFASDHTFYIVDSVELAASGGGDN